LYADRWMPWIVGTLFTLTYAGLAVGRLPGLRVDRAMIAYCGAALMLCVGALSLDEATSPRAIDYGTIVLLLGMMVVVGFLRVGGAFARVTRFTLARVKSPTTLLAAVVLIGGGLSAFLVNDVVCIALTPLVLHVARRLRYDPVPHLIGLATASNVGSAGTITGNPQNMIIGSASGLSYLHFAIHLLPVAAIGLVINFAVIALLYRRALTSAAASSGRIGPACVADVSARR
jgi:Na+/H+ antiporter NhaD/arsenite permease-like protein